MKMPNFYTCDFETLPIEQRPSYPPKPVSMSIKEPGKRSRWWGWAHPSGNNCSLADAKRALQAIWRPSNHLLFFNGKFDVDVAETHMGVPRLPALNMHDGMFIAFLRDPHSRELALKPLAEQWLQWPPTERDLVDEWAKKNKAELLTKFFSKPFRPGAYIGFAPGELVKPYNMADTDMTAGLAKDGWKYMNDMGMLEAYQREQRIMPIFLNNEREGMRVDLPGLQRDIPIYQAALGACDVWLRKRLKSKDLNLDNDEEVAEALARAKVVPDDAWVMTKTGKRSVAKDNLTPDMFRDLRVAKAFGYRNRLTTCLKMFMLPWLEQASVNGGRISYSWNQVRGTGGGTRSGRPSMTRQNLLNVSKTWGVDDGYEHPDFMDVLELPLVRRYALPDKGGLWLHRDYNGQELRILAHAEDGPLMQAYKENPWLDVHQHVADLIEEKTGKTFARKNVKIANFRIIYGGGAPATAAGVGCTLAEAKDLLDAHGKALPSVKGKGGLSDATKEMGRNGDAIYTWGGRAYYVEEPGFNKKYGRHMTYEYKLLNYYCQGSAADVTKEAIIRYHEHPKRTARFSVTVYDEINASTRGKTKAEVREQMFVLRETMESIEMDVPMLSEGKVGETWGDQSKFNDERN